MRLTEKHIHARLFEAIDVYTAWALSGGEGSPSEPLVKAFQRHQKVWWREYGKGLMLGVGTWFAAFIGLVAFDRNVMDLPFSREIAVVWMALGGFWLYHAWKRNERTFTPEELETLVPALNLEPILRLYGEALIALFKNGGIGNEHRDEIIESMKSLLDEDTRLAERRGILAAAIGSPDEMRAIEGEIQELEERIARSRDAVARETLQESLVIAHRRRDRLAGGEPLVERIDAQRELIRQTMAGFRESLSRMPAKPADVDYDDVTMLRDRVAAVARQGQALEAAYDELRALA